MIGKVSNSISAAQLPSPIARLYHTASERMGVRHTLIWLLPLLAACLLVGSAAVSAPRTVTVTLGQEEYLNDQGEARNLYNLLGWGQAEQYGERSARRAGASASFIIPLAFRLDTDLELTLISCGCGIHGTAMLTINDMQMPVTLTDQWQVQRFVLTHTPSIHGNDLYLAWHSANDLGPLVHRASIAPATPALPLFEGGILALTVAGMLWVGRRQSLRLLLPWVALVVLCMLAGQALYERHLLPWPVLLAYGGIAAVLLTFPYAAPAAAPWTRFVLWGVVLWVLAVPQLFGTWLMDDAFISFRYSRNLIEGHGLTFNPGGAIVEGYTNFLWVIYIAGGLALGFEPVLLAQATTLAIALFCLTACYGLARQWLGTRWALAAPVLLAAMPAFLTYSARGSGMETALVALLAVLALWAIWRAQTWQGGLLRGCCVRWS
ncbi:MAG: hypothetical protein HC876_21335 [Chloroflexaceae bacterium]|nr:hypothetical protein [Chloroflexaceae bacterium]